MPLHLRGIRLTPDEDRTDLKTVLAGILHIPPDRIRSLRILKRSIDARHDVRILYQVEISTDREEELYCRLKATEGILVDRAETDPPLFVIQKKIFPQRPVIVGFGPAGIFASLLLARAGAEPIVLERGRSMENRVGDVASFWAEGAFQPESNVCFGEGGAGTFSDGKLTTGKRSAAIPWLLSELVAAGAPGEILYEARPHIGTDRLRGVIVALRKKIESLGGEIRFETRMAEILLQEGRLRGIRLQNGEEIETDTLLLATGHGAADTYEVLQRAGVGMESKPLAMGVRIEHPQDMLDRVQYGRWAGHSRLGASLYRLTYRDRTQDRGVYSFCMCPGGRVIAANSQAGRIVTNGMSHFARTSGYANSGLVVTVAPKDFSSREPLSGLAYLRGWEETAYRAGGENYFAPAQRVTDFLRRTVSSTLPETTYRPGVCTRDLHELLPDFVATGLKRAIRAWGRRMPGFVSEEGVLIGVETRTSSPVRILRGTDYVSVTVKGLYPLGEGAGYAGGIVSSALDGVYCVLSLLGIEAVKDRGKAPRSS